MRRLTKSHWLLMLLLAAGFIWSVIVPRDRIIWWLEVAPIIIALPVLVFSYRRFELTPLAYWLIGLHALILLIGAHYTYAEVPAFNYLRDSFDWSRNYYDRVGHLAQGFVPAIIAREILLRKSVLTAGRWLFFITCCICLSISVVYEFIEWWVAVYAGAAADTFLATQGDVWDTQWDMFCALVGAIAAQCLLAKVQDKQLIKMQLGID